MATGGSEPRWRADRKELFYLTGGPDTRMMALDVRAGETLTELFPVSLVTRSKATWRWVQAPDFVDVSCIQDAWR